MRVSPVHGHFFFVCLLQLVLSELFNMSMINDKDNNNNDNNDNKETRTD